ncbi:hypothetical protein RKD31_000678 [Streptomyces sp. SAI-163]
MTSENVAEQDAVESAVAVSAKAADDQLVSRAQAEGLQLTGEGGLLQQLTKWLLESALEGEITDHRGMTSTIRRARAAATPATANAPRPR